MSKIFYFHVKKVGQTPTGLTKRQRGKGAKKDKKSLQKVRICRYKGYQNENVPCYKPKTHHQNPKSLTYIVSVVAFVYVQERAKTAVSLTQGNISFFLSSSICFFFKQGMLCVFDVNSLVFTWLFGFLALLFHSSTL